jgi:hypothetical protein
MTVCAIVRLNDAIVAIADGRLTSGDRKSFDTTEKIVQIQPSFKVPQISMGRLDGFSELNGPFWYVAYAGTYALCSEILNIFRNRITTLFLERDYDYGGAPQLVSSFEKGRNFADDYNFRPDEIPQFDSSTIATEFKQCCQLKADEWLDNGKPLDCEFLLFGSTDDKAEDSFPAFKISVERDAMLQSAHVRVERLARHCPSVIGDPLAASAIATDTKLRDLISASIPQENPADSDLDRWLALNEPSKTGSIEKRLVEIVRCLNVSSIGGRLTIASNSGRRTITLRYIE